MNLVKRFTNRILLRKNPVKYWMQQGVRFPGGAIGVEIYPGVDFGSEPYLIEIGNHVRLNKNVTIITHDGGVWVLRALKDKYKDIDIIKPVRIGNNVHVVHYSIIMPGVTIGDNCIIGCGSIVTHSIPSNSVAVGVPARVIESIHDYETKHVDDFIHTKNLTSLEKKDFLINNWSK